MVDTCLYHGWSCWLGMGNGGGCTILPWEAGAVSCQDMHRICQNFAVHFGHELEAEVTQKKRRQVLFGQGWGEQKDAEKAWGLQMSLLKWQPAQIMWREKMRKGQQKILYAIQTHMSSRFEYSSAHVMSAVDMLDAMAGRLSFLIVPASSFYEVLDILRQQMKPRQCTSCKNEPAVGAEGGLR